MNGREIQRLFISYAHRDGAHLATRLHKDLTTAGFDTWADVERLNGGAVWTTQIEHEVDTRNVILALLTPGSYESYICRAEHLRALRKGRRLIPVLAVDADLPYLEILQYRDFTNPARYAEDFQQLLTDIRGGITATLVQRFRNTEITDAAQHRRA